MSLDDKLKHWREATDALVPPDALQAKLAAAVETPGSSPAPAAAATKAGTLIKVLIVALAVGAAGWAVSRAFAPVATWWASASATPSAPAPATPAPAPHGPMAPATVLQPPCPPREQVLFAEALVPAPATSKEQLLADARVQLARRPLTREGQLAPVDALLFGSPEPDDARSRLRARKAFLCGASTLTPSRPLPMPLALGIASGPPPRCDDSNWCHEPACNREEEPCQRQLAALPVTSCAGEVGRYGLLETTCISLVRGALTDTQARAELDRLSAELTARPGSGKLPEPWCLLPAARGEVRARRERGATRGALPR